MEDVSLSIVLRLHNYPPPFFIGFSLNLEKELFLNIHDDVFAAPVVLSPLCMYKKNSCELIE